MSAAYLTRAEYAARVGGAANDAPSDLELRLASDRVDASGPFLDERADTEQERQFPRGDSTSIPDPVLDAVCLLAQAEAEGQDETPVVSESVMQASKTYAGAKLPRHLKRVGELLRPYQRKSGRIR